jgi:hypothetical protein
MDDFALPEGMVGRFAVVKLWPKLTTAEDEVIARLKVAARVLGVECVEILADGRTVAPPHTRIARGDVDFALHLHFETPKAYDIFSLVALWNPLQIIHGYIPGRFQTLSRHLLSHDDFLSCDSPEADDHIRRMIVNDPTRDGPALQLFHSLASPILPPGIGDQKLFYAGINWEIVCGRKTRHQELLKLLDTTGKLRIHGPHVFAGMEVWKGYNSYAGPIPFDGVSMIHAIHDAGIALVLSSPAHMAAGLMSNRLFESTAAGAVVICDGNAFARRHFGDSLLYVDTDCSVEETFRQVCAHLYWISTHRTEATDLARRAQDIFKERFRLDSSLRQLYEKLPARRQRLRDLVEGARETPVTLFYLMPRYSRDVLERHLETASNLEYGAATHVLLIDAHERRWHAREIDKLVAAARVPVEVRPVDFHRRSADGTARSAARLGAIVHGVIAGLAEGELYGFVGPEERLFSDHLRLAAGALARNPAALCAHTDAVWQLPDGEDGGPRLELLTDLDLRATRTGGSVCFGRFLFRMPRNTAPLACLLPYLDSRALVPLVALGKRVEVRRATLLTKPPAEAVSRDPAALDMEDEAVQSFLPACHEPEAIWNSSPASPSASPASDPGRAIAPVASPEQRAAMARDLFYAVPMPRFVRAIMRRFYRLVRRFS